MDSARGAQARGILYYCAGLEDRAAEAFQRAAQGRPTAKTLYLLGLSRAASGASPDALGALREAIALDPDLYMAYHQMNAVYRARREFAAAVSILEEARKRFAGTTYEPYADNELGLTYEQQGRLQEAVACARRAVAGRTGDTVPAQVNLALFLYKLREFAEARWILERILARSASHAVPHPSRRTSFLVYYTLGGLALEERDPGSARRLLAQALEFSRESAAAWNGLGIACEAAGDHAAALEALQEALRLDPGFTAARRNIAFVSRRQHTEAPSWPT